MEEQENNSQEIQVSLFASSNRPGLYPMFFKSLINTSVNYEVVFAGNCKNIVTHCEDGFYQHQLENHAPLNLTGESLRNNENMFFKYIETANIKPSQCYEIARRACKGEVVVWVADDCEFPNDVIGKAYKYWKSKRNEKLILSIQTKESGYGLPQGQLFDMDVHRFFGGVKTSPLMAPLGMMSREFLNDIGGFDRRYICGQYENQCVIMAMMKGGTVEIFGGPDCFIDIDHMGKSLLIGESKKESDFLKRPFAKGYDHDRRILESVCCIDNGRISLKTNFEPYEDKDIMLKSQSFKGDWE